MTKFVEKTGGYKILYTGFGNFTPIAVNPTADEIRKIYNKTPEDEIREPNYQIKDDTTKIEIWCKYIPVEMDSEELKKNPPIVRYTVFVGRDEVHSMDGSKKQFVNHQNKAFYYKNIEEIKERNSLETEDWKKFSLEGVRVAMKGEVQLMDFIVALFNADRKKNILQFDNFGKICDGNVRELKEHIENAQQSNRLITLLCTVKDGQYQDVFSGVLRVNHTPKEKEKLINDLSRYKGSYTLGMMKKAEGFQAPASLEEEDNPFTDDEPVTGFNSSGEWVGMEEPKQEKKSLF